MTSSEYKIDAADPSNFISVENSTFTFIAPKYVCSKHGVIEHTFKSTIVGHEGDWCLLCFVNWIADNVPRVTKL